MDTSNLLEVTSSKLFTDKQLSKADPDGLLSEQIFGPIYNFRCQCGTFNSKILHENETCPNCGVKCISNESRYTTWGKISLLFPVIKKQKLEIINKLIKKKFKYLLDPLQSDLTTSVNTFIRYDQYTDKIDLVNDYGFECLPLAITGLYSLYISLYSISKYYDSAYAEELLECFSNEILVIPPNCRMSLVSDDKGNKKIFKSDLDDLYSNLINIQGYNKENHGSYVDKDQYYNMVKISLDNNLDTPIMDDQLRMLDSTASYFQFYTIKIHDKVSEILSGKSGLIRKDFLGKFLDFSSRAVTTCDLVLDAHEIRIPKKSFMKLWYLEYLRYLKVHQGYTLDKVKYLVKRSEVEDFTTLEFVNEFITHTLTNTDTKSRLILMNRVPSLWRFSIPVAEVVGVNEDDVITVSPMIIEAMNMDFDGDTASLFKIHDKNAQQELLDNAFHLNIIKYDHNDQYLATIKNEAVYAFNLLVMAELDDKLEPLNISHLQDLPFDYDLMLELSRPVNLNNTTIPYGLALLNKWLGCSDIKITTKNDPQDISDIIWQNSDGNRSYQSNLSEVNRKLNWFLTSHQTQTLTFELEESCNLLESCLENPLLKELPRNPYIGIYVFNAIADNVINNIPKDYNLLKLLKAKFKKGQFLRSLVSCGYVADDKNEISYDPINATLLGGLSEDDFFTCSIGTRKGLCDKQSLTPKSGYLNRSMIMNLSPLEIIEDDCGTEFGFEIRVQNKIHANSLVNRYYKDLNNEWRLTTLDFLLQNIGVTFYFRSTITCQTKGFKLCRKCFGEYGVADKKFVGIHTGAVISERLTQLSMRSFHNTKWP